MRHPRLRVFAGPNGSGKSTLFESFSQKYSTGHFLNADTIENELATKGFIDLSYYNLELNQHDLDKFYTTDRAKTLIDKSNNDNHRIDISIIENMIIDKEKSTHSYEGALISSFLRYHLQKKKIDFCFETVMSHPSKIDELIEARENGYKTYLYFICIDDPEINISRVENRVQKGGHNVDNSKIESRYYNTLNNLISAIENTDKCYLFDNSEDKFRLVAKVVEGKLRIEIEPEFLPNWFINYVLKYYINIDTVKTDTEK
jgi:predicted ABC-type ATPase